MAQDLQTSQYHYVCESRKVMLAFLSSLDPVLFHTKVECFDDKNLSSVVIHIINVYRHWIGNYALRLDMAFYNEASLYAVSQLISLFIETDKLMDQFFLAYAANWRDTIKNEISGRKVESDPLKIFTHVITHEFHHKGQMMSMCRLLGHPAPDTDIIRL